MEGGIFYRINIKFLELSKLSPGFITRYQREIETNSIYLGTRFNPTSFNRSAAINSLELANQFIILANEFLKDDYGKVDCNLCELLYSTNYMKSIIDTDTRTLMAITQGTNFTPKINGTHSDNQAIAKKVRKTLTE